METTGYLNIDVRRLRRPIVFVFMPRGYGRKKYQKSKQKKYQKSKQK